MAAVKEGATACLIDTPFTPIERTCTGIEAANPRHATIEVYNPIEVDLAAIECGTVCTEAGRAAVEWVKPPLTWRWRTRSTALGNKSRTHTPYDFPKLMKVSESLARQSVERYGGSIEIDEVGREVFVIPANRPYSSHSNTSGKTCLRAMTLKEWENLTVRNHRSKCSMNE